jgi:hypothetical protein
MGQMPKNHPMIADVELSLNVAPGPGALVAPSKNQMPIE